MFSGYIFWLIISKFTTPDVIGTAATVVSVSGIFITVSTMGIKNGIQRLLGKSFAKKEISNSKIFLKAAFFLNTVGIVASSVFIFVAQNWIVEIFSIDISLIFISIVIISSTCYYRLLRSIIVASLRTKMLTIAMGISSITKISLALILINFGAGAFGILVGIAAFDILASIILAMSLLPIFKTKEKPTLQIFESMRILLSASLVSWVPNLIMNTGTHLGTIVVFGSQGASQAGIYFISFAIITAILALMRAPLGIAFPKLSGMVDGRKRFAWGVTKICLVVFLPLSLSIFFYSEEILLLFGESYLQGTLTFQILLISMLPLTVLGGIRSLTYAYGNYSQVLAIGIFMSVPRILLYFILVPFMGGVGAGISFTVGSLIGFVASIIIAKKIGFKIFWKDLGILLAIPVGLSWIFSNFEVSFLIGIPVTIILSYILYLKIRVITKNELEDSMEVLPKKIRQPAKNFINEVSKKLKIP